MGRNPHMLFVALGNHTSLTTLRPWRYIVLVRSLSEWASHALIATFFAVSITPAVKSSNATAKVMPHLTNAALSLMPPINLSNAI